MNTSPTLRRRTLVAALACSALPVARAADGAITRPWPRTQPTPPLALPGHDGTPWTMAQARGRPLLLNFWASWCEPCRTEMPTLELLAARHEADGLVVVAVNFRETDAAVGRFLAQMPITLPILRDRDGAAARAWQVRVFPTTVLVARDGRARLSVVGGVEWNSEQARRWIAPLL